MDRFPTRPFVSLLTALFITFLVGNVSPMIPQVSAAAGNCEWHKVSSPSIGGVLWGVSALTPTDAWMVGSNGGSRVIEHRDDTRWSAVHSPNIGTISNGLSAVTAFSSSDIWAVGDDSNGKAGARTLIEHWNGKRWSIVQSPSIGPFDNELWSVAGVAPNDIWAIGLYWASPGNVTDTLAEHWDGSTWSVVSSPNPPGSDNDLHGVAAVASNDV